MPQPLAGTRSFLWSYFLPTKETTMDDREQKQRERAYKIWEDEGRVDGHHLDHWKRAEEEDETTEEQATGATEQASEKVTDGAS